MRKLRIGFSRNKKGAIFSKLLMWYMEKDYSHTYFLFDTTRIFDDQTILHSSLSGGVGYWAKSIFDKYNTTTAIYEIEVCEETYKLIRSHLHKHAGEKYAFWQNLGIIAVDTLKYFGIKKKNPFRKGENCSELVFLALSKIHPELLNKYTQDSIRPDHIEDILIEYDFKKVG